MMRCHSERLGDSMDPLAQSCATANEPLRADRHERDDVRPPRIAQSRRESRRTRRALVATLDRGTPWQPFARDANDARASIQLVLVQPSISSQMIDNLNASIHLRALLTDLFLIDEIVRPEAASVPSANAPTE